MSRNSVENRERVLLTRLGAMRGREAWPTRVELMELWFSRPERGAELLAQMRAAVKEDPSHPEAWGALSDVCRAQGLREEALTALERAAATAVRSPDRARRWAQLAELRKEVAAPAGVAAKSPAPSRRPRPAADVPGKDVVAFVRGGMEVSGASGPGAVPVSPSATSVPPASKAVLGRLETGRAAVHASPLEPGGYQTLAQLFAELGDSPRAELMEEIAEALEGKAPHRSASRLPLQPAERAGLRHPLLRQPAGELLSLAGPVLLPLVLGADEGPALPAFEEDDGPGAGTVGQALKLAAQVLALPELDVCVARTGRAALELRFDGELSVAVRKDAVDRELPKGLLRFEAGAAVFSQQWDLAVLRLLGPDALGEGLAQLARGLAQEKKLTAGARARLAAMPRPARARLELLLQSEGKALDLRALRKAARASAHRAGLVVAGSLGPGLDSLRLGNAGSEAQRELVHFAASERFFELRLRARPAPSVPKR